MYFFILQICKIDPQNEFQQKVFNVNNICTDFHNIVLHILKKALEVVWGILAFTPHISVRRLLSCYYISVLLYRHEQTAM